MTNWQHYWRRIEVKTARARTHRKRTAKMRKASRRLTRPKHTARRGSTCGRRNPHSSKSWR